MKPLEEEKNLLELQDEQQQDQDEDSTPQDNVNGPGYNGIQIVADIA